LYYKNPFFCLSNKPFQDSILYSYFFSENTLSLWRLKFDGKIKACVPAIGPVVYVAVPNVEELLTGASARLPLAASVPLKLNC
jgi:hypothetical protein